MKISKSAFLIAIAFFSYSAEIVAEEAPDAVQEYVDTNNYACTSGELKRIKADVIRIAGSRNPDNAWHVVNTMLCREDEPARRFMLKHMSKTITFVQTGLDESDTQLIDASSDLLLGKHALELSLKVADVSVENIGDIAIHYSLIPSCIGSFIIRFNGRAWLLTKIEEGCC